MQTSLPIRIQNWLNARGLTNKVLEDNNIGWNGTHIVIPVYDIEGKKLFNKYRRDPDILIGEKYLYERGSHVTLYGIKNLSKSNQVIICEGEFDSLILEANGFSALTSTGGAGTFKEDWVSLFSGKEVFVCFDNDPAGFKGAEKVLKLIPGSKSLPIPREIKDITEFFVILKKTADDFRCLMRCAFVPIFKKEVSATLPSNKKKNNLAIDKLSAAKQFPIKSLIKVNSAGFAKCIFHNDKTASMKIYSDNHFHCFSCSRHGDAIDIAMQVFGISMKEALIKLL